MAHLDFSELERPLQELRQQIQKIEQFARDSNLPEPAELARHRDHLRRLEERIYSNLTAWDKTLIARHPQRPQALDFMRNMFEEFTELHGDRKGTDEGAIVVGLARLDGRRVAVIAQQKGRDAKERKQRNFGMARPGAYRKGMRMMELADRFHLPLITLVDTPAADPGVESEQAGISWVIAESMARMFRLTVPVVSAVLGEGGSGGAIALACANKVLMLQYAIYSVIPPEGCAAILWRDPNRRAEAAAALRLTADDALQFGLADDIVPEPPGAAHTYPLDVAASLREALSRALSELEQLAPSDLVTQRRTRFERLGVTLSAV
ncbi:MAG: acetyl-coenzyme A carboxylase carboxyl transferase subunit alpha [Fimbriimonadales bacterium]